MIRNQGKESIFGLMGHSMKENFIMIKETVLEQLYGMMGLVTVDNGRMV